jgi:hypothetical protein
MISVVIQTLGDEEALLASLGALVSAAADGTVRDVIVVDGAHSSSVAAIADGFGCSYLAGSNVRAARLAAGARAAKGPWLLFLEPGAEPEEGWCREVRQFLERAGRRTGPSAATFRVEMDEASGTAARALSRIRRMIHARPDEREALLISKAHYEELGGFRDLPVVEYIDLARRIGAARITRLRARLFVPARTGAPSELGSGVRRAVGLGLLAVRAPMRLVARLYS